MHAIKHLKLLDPDASKFLFACFDYKKKKRPKIIQASLNDSIKKLKELNEKEGYCVYVTVNETDGTVNEKNVPQRKLENIVRCRAIWVEDDSKQKKPRTDFPIEPSFIIESSENKFHYYWLTSTKNFGEWDAVMESMVQEWGCDPNARDRARVLRLAGFDHNKDLDNTFTSRIVGEEGHVYRWTEIKKQFGMTKKPVKKAKTNGNGKEQETEIKGFDQHQAVQDIIDSNNYHNSLVSLALSLTNKNVDRELQLYVLQSIMHAVPKKKRREEWEARLGDEHLYECIDSAIKKVSEEQLNDIVDIKRLSTEAPTEIGSNVEHPPGPAGDLCREIYEMAPHPNKIIAVAGGVAIMSGICGRRFNVSGTGLNLYITVLADSGIGKSNLKNSIHRALRVDGPLGMGKTFIGHARFTGPKPIYDMLQKGMSRICPMEEAGLLSESKAGDSAGISRAMLDLYTSSGFGEYSGNEAYSNSENNIPILKSPALSIVSISTPKSYLRSMKTNSAEVSGELARMWIMRNTEKKEYYNRNTRKDFSNKIKEKIKALIKFCAKSQNPDNESDVKNMKIPEFCLDDANVWTDLENKYMSEKNALRRTLCSRAWIKSLKMAALVSIFNDKGDQIGREEYLWAKNEVEQELKFIEHTFYYSDTGSIQSVIQNYLSPIIVKMVAGEYRSVKQCPPQKMREKGMFSLYNLRQITQHSALLSDIEQTTRHRSGCSGLDICIEQMLKESLIVEVTPRELKNMRLKAAKAYRLTSEFEIRFSIED